MFDWYLVLFMVALNGQPQPPTFIPVASFEQCQKAVTEFWDKQKIPPGYAGVVGGCGKRISQKPQAQTPDSDMGGTHEDNNPFHTPPQDQL